METEQSYIVFFKSGTNQLNAGSQLTVLHFVIISYYMF